MQSSLSSIESLRHTNRVTDEWVTNFNLLIQIYTVLKSDWRPNLSCMCEGGQSPRAYSYNISSTNRDKINHIRLSLRLDR